MKFTERGITQQEIEETLKAGKAALEPFFGILAKREKLKLLVFLVAFVICVAMSLAIGLNGDLKHVKRNARWFWPLFIMTIYLIAVFVANWQFNKRTSIFYRMSHFILSVFCRTENNRLYL